LFSSCPILVFCSAKTILPGAVWNEPGKPADMEKLIGILSGVLTSASMLPQFIKLIRSKDSKDISLGMLGVLIAGVGGWTFYGVLKTDWILIITNSFAFLLNSITLALAIVYRRK
jgi:MtN3 and saliva related transmembrane protein